MSSRRKQKANDVRPFGRFLFVKRETRDERGVEAESKETISEEGDRKKREGTKGEDHRKRE